MHSDVIHSTDANDVRLRALPMRFIDILLGALAMLLVVQGFYHFSRSSRNLTRESVVKSARLSIGSVLKLDGNLFSDHSRSLVLAIAPSCASCEASAPFYTIAAYAASKHETPFVVLVPDKKSSHVPIPHAIQRDIDFKTAGIERAPVMFLVDRKGIVIDAWEGPFTAFEEQQVLSSIARERAPSVTDFQGAISESGWKALNDPKQRIFLDISEREVFDRHHRDGAINIPLDELEQRSRHELDPSKTFLVDCTRIPSAMCDFAVKILSLAGFHSVGVFNRGAYNARVCSGSRGLTSSPNGQ